MRSLPLLVGLLVLLVTLLVLIFCWTTPGPLTIDDVTYHRMTRDLLHGHGFFIANGYEQFHSEELAGLYIRPGRDHIAAQYPYGGPAIAAPFYLLFGMRGLFVVNALAVVCAVWLTFRIAIQLLEDRAVALGAAALLVTTFLAEYGLAIWPHASATAATLGATSLAIVSYQRRSAAHALASGLVAAVGLTLRLDVALCIPAFIAPILFSHSTRWRSVGAFLAGLVPGVAFLSLTNHARWDTWFPLVYGGMQDAAKYLALGLTGATFLALVWFASRPSMRARMHEHPRLTLLAALLIGLGFILVMPTAPRGALALMFDLRARPVSREILLDTRVLVAFGDYKKALFQSCPVLIAAALPILRAVRGQQRLAVGWLSIVPLSLLGFFGTFAWHGGTGVNMRYLLPALPFLCVLSAMGIRELAKSAPAASRYWFGLGFAFAACAYGLLLPQSFDASVFFLLTVPLIVVTIAAAAMWRRKAVVALATLGLAAGWTAASTVHDARWSQRVRHNNYSASWSAAQLIPDGALVFVSLPEPHYQIVEFRPNVIIAVTTNDRYEDAARLAREALDEGRPVYVVFIPPAFESLRVNGGMTGAHLREVGRARGYLVGEITRATN